MNQPLIQSRWHQCSQCKHRLVIDLLPQQVLPNLDCPSCEQKNTLVAVEDYQRQVVQI